MCLFFDGLIRQQLAFPFERQKRISSFLYTTYFVVMWCVFSKKKYHTLDSLVSRQIQSTRSLAGLFRGQNYAIEYWLIFFIKSSFNFEKIMFPICCKFSWSNGIKNRFLGMFYFHIGSVISSLSNEEWPAVNSRHSKNNHQRVFATAAKNT